MDRLREGQRRSWRNTALLRMRGVATVTRIPEDVDVSGKAVCLITYPTSGAEEVVWYQHHLLACTDPV